jgi:hypothetical protein
MKATSLLIGITCCLFTLSSSAAAMFTPSYHLTGTLTNETQVFFLGKTSMKGTLYGYPLEQMIVASLAQGMGGFPLVGPCSIANLESVIIAEDIDITAARSLDDLLDRYSSHITTYTDVDIAMEDGLFILGISQGSLNVSADLPYAVTTVLPLDIITDTSERFFLTVTASPLTLQCMGDYAVISTLVEQGTIRVTNRQGTIVWSDSSPNNYLIIEASSFSVIQHPPLSVFPLPEDPLHEPLTLRISPADPGAIRIEELIEAVSDSMENLGQDTTSGFMTAVSEFNAIIKTTSLAANGAMVFQHTNDSLTIDRSIQQFSGGGFIRFRTLDITKVGSSTGLTLQADCKCCFLGDHFYNARAKRSSDGIVFPFEVLIIWIIALSVFIYVRIFLRPLVDPSKDEKIKRYGLIVHIIALIVSFILVDVEVNDIFGVSASTSLFTQGFSPVTGLFLLLELLLWVLGYLILSIPLQLISYSVLRYLGYGDGGKGIRKAIGDLSIWVFCGLYLLLFVNVILSLIHFNTLVPVG